MVRRVLGIQERMSADASDGLAVALCHLHRAVRLPALALITPGADRPRFRRGRKVRA